MDAGGVYITFQFGSVRPSCGENHSPGSSARPEMGKLANFPLQRRGGEKRFFLYFSFLFFSFPLSPDPIFSLSRSIGYVQRCRKSFQRVTFLFNLAYY